MVAEGDARASEPITRREREILQLLSEDLSDKDIAARLFLSVGTVKWHVQNIFSKLGVERRAQAVKQAHDRGLISSSMLALQSRDERLPLDTTSFVDRRVETQRIGQILDNPACRLLTLVGSGGIGKTRLALHVARNMPNHSPDGKIFVSLVGISSSQYLAATLANALSFSFYGAEEPETQILRYLSRKKALLIFDNYEHLLPDVALLVQILEQAPGVKLMITSRERLNIREEWVFQVEGLAVKSGAGLAVDAAADACDLFVQRASQINAAFQGIGQDMPFVLQICRQLEGIPLAIELAAGWARSLTAQEIAQEMSKSYQLLRTALQNVPERHRSMGAVFEQTWTRLSTQEQAAMEGLSVFRGGFTREAAEQVAGADLSLLAALQDKSLVTLASSGRYGIHELLRQFAEAKLAVDSKRHSAALDRHSQYFARLLWKTRRSVIDTHQRETVAALNIDIDNIWQAWQWLVSQEDWAAFDLAWETVTLFCYVTARFHEGVRLFSLALDRLRPPFAEETHFRVRIIALTQTAILLFMIDQIGAGLKWVDEALALVDNGNINDARLLIYLFNTYTLLLWARGEYEKALEQCHLLQQVAAQTDDFFYQQQADYDFGIVYLHLGEFERARTHFYHVAGFGNELGRAFANNFLGLIAETSGDTQEAQALFTQSLDLFRQIENPWGIGMSLINLGRNMGRSGTLREAAACLYEALDFALDIQTPQQIVGAVVEIAFLFQAIDRALLAVAVLEFLKIHSVAWQEYKERIAPYLAELRLLVETNSPVVEKSQASFTTMDQVIDAVQAARREFQASS